MTAPPALKKYINQSINHHMSQARQIRKLEAKHQLALFNLVKQYAKNLEETGLERNCRQWANAEWTRYCELNKRASIVPEFSALDKAINHYNKNPELYKNKVVE